MSNDELLDRAADIIAGARSECLKLGISPKELAGLFLDDAVLGLYVEGNNRQETTQFFKDFVQRRIRHWYSTLPKRD